MKRYNKWSKVPDNLKTKTQLNQLGLKPKPGSEAVATFLSTAYGRREYKLYDINNCAPIKKIKPRELDVNDDNIAEALYVINKSAKTSRDTKRSSFCSQKYDVVNRSKVRESKLYELKDKVLQKLLAENKANIKGIHKQKIKKEHSCNEIK